MARSNAVVRAGLVLIHLIFLVGSFFAAVDLWLLQSSSSEEWGGIGLFAISMVLGFPWSLAFLLGVSMLQWDPLLMPLLGLSLVINYAFLIRSTPDVWRGRE